MTTTTKKKAFDIDKLTKWLEDNNGCVVHRFEIGGHTEQIDEARKFAEQMRKNLGSSKVVSIVQSYNRVTISLVEVGALSA